MKNVLFASVALFALGFANAQESDSNGGQTSKGKWLIETNTNFGAVHLANTGFQFTSVEGATYYNLGLEGGYFIADNLALKAGLGFGVLNPDEGGSSTSFSYKLGAKYYLLSMIPLQIDYSGAKTKNFDDSSYLGLQAGYAVFLGQNVSIEPGIRFNKSLNEDYEDVLQFNIGFVLHF